MKKSIIFIIFISLFIHLDAQMLITTAQMNNINSSQSAFEGQIYKNTETNIFYIGLSGGTLKTIGELNTISSNASLTGDGTSGSPLGIAPMGASTGQALVWNGTSWAPSSVASGTTYLQNDISHSTTTVGGNGTVYNPYYIMVNGATTTSRGIIQLTGDLDGTDTWPVIRTGAVSNSKLGANAVTSDKIQNGEVKTADLEWGAVTTDKIADNNVTLAKLQQIPSLTLIGNPYGSTGTPIAINIGTGFTISSGNTLNATGSSWSLTGNSGTNPSTNFLGTTDYNRLVFKTNNIERATFLPTGYFGLGITNPSATFHNNGTTVFSVRTISNRTLSGDIGSAGSTVDIGTNFAVNQTTPGLNFTLPSTATAGKMVKISNSGTAAFTMYNTVIAPSKFAEFMWTGSTWIPMTGGSSSVVNKKMVLSAEYAGAVVTPGNETTSHNGDLYGDNTGSTGPYAYYYMNYYHWESRSGSGPHSYQIIVRVTLPNDFTEWETTNAIQYVHMAQASCSVELDIYNVTTNTQIYYGSPLTSGSWTTTDIPGNSLTNWVTPGQTVAIVITMRASTNGNYARIGDIILNYK